MSEVYFKNVDELRGIIFSLLKKQGLQAVDMHFHSNHSVDGLSSIKDIIKKCRKDGIGTSITDHNQISGALKAKRLSGKGVFIVPGIELTCHNGVHVLLHFSDIKEYKEFYQKELKARVKKNPWFLDKDHHEMIDIAHNYNCLITAPHPYGPGFIGIRKFKSNLKTVRKIDAVEVINGCLVGKMNPKAIEWAKEMKKGFTGGSDGHSVKELGNAVTICQAQTAEEFLEQIRKRKSIVIGKQERILDDAINNYHKFKHEKKVIPRDVRKKMMKDRRHLEWSYLKNKVKEKDFLHHYHSHHQEPKKTWLEKHPHTKHLVDKVRKKKDKSESKK